MKYIFLLQLLATLSFANIENINSFEADFKQDVINEKGDLLSYSGHIHAKKPQLVLWNYVTPVKKEIYVSKYEVVIIEPEIEQAIVKVVNSDFDFFSMIKNAKKIGENSYSASFKDSIFKIKLFESKIESISYIDEFENSVKISFTNQEQDKEIDKGLFTPVIPQDFDVIRD